MRPAVAHVRASVRHCRCCLRFWPASVPHHSIGHHFFLDWPWESSWCVMDRVSTDTAKMIFYFYSVNCLVRWIIGRIGKIAKEVVKSLIWHDNQAFPCLIITISDTSKYQPKRLDSDNQINMPEHSRLHNMLGKIFARDPNKFVYVQYTTCHTRSAWRKETCDPKLSELLHSFLSLVL